MHILLDLWYGYRINFGGSRCFHKLVCISISMCDNDYSLYRNTEWVANNEITAIQIFD